MRRMKKRALETLAREVGSEACGGWRDGARGEPGRPRRRAAAADQGPGADARQNTGVEHATGIAWGGPPMSTYNSDYSKLCYNGILRCVR